MAEVDFEAEGLLEGLEGKEREARLELLEELASDGVPTDELRRAVQEDRLALLPVERVLSGGGPKYSADDIDEKTGLDVRFLEKLWRSLGLAPQPDDEVAYTERDLESAQRIAALLDAGLPEDGVLEVARLLGMNMSQLAAANRGLIRETFLQPGDTEHDVARRFAIAAEAFGPLIAESLGYVLNLHLREQIRHDTIGADEVSAGRVDMAQQVTVCFTDMVGFTRLGDTLHPDQLGSVTGRLSELVAEVVEPPVRVVKMIGDAAMLVAPESAPVVEAALGLVQAAEQEGEDFPLLRGGVAGGRAIARAGDWYGRPVNLASRITERARPGSVLAAKDVRDELRDAYAWSFAGAKSLKGIEAEVPLYRCRRRDGDNQEDES
jgi:adenylate cyclase